MVIEGGQFLYIPKRALSLETLVQALIDGAYSATHSTP